jgi:mannose-1-phosphate guanylyltransferase
VTVADQADQLKELAPAIPDENYLLEPFPRGTASVVGLAAIALRQRDPDAVMAIVTSDHAIGNEGYFHRLLSAAYHVAQDRYLVTLGITPQFPSTGYGYIQLGEPLSSYDGQEVYRAVRFREKPDVETARAFLAGRDHAWNSGMFVWRADLILNEFNRQMPGLANGLDKIQEVWGMPAAGATINSVWTGLTAETIDYGIMEGASQTVVIPARDLAWSDVGTWDSLFGILPVDSNGNIIQGHESVLLGAQDSLFLDSTNEKLIVGIGVKDLVVVNTEDVLMICHREQVQKVRDVVNQLRATHREKYL